MSLTPDKISGVPTNIITGFLGVGKTSTILHLLSKKPADERWAILVNEFGEIGVDGALFEGKHSERQGVFIREVPGGCMCCTAGLPMRVALTQLLRQAKPDRLLIEPTGLGHPREVLETLNDESYRGVLAIQKIVTLVDARHLSDSRYVEHDTFQQQIAIADVIVANKQDLCSDNDIANLKAYLTAQGLLLENLVFAENGVIETTLLDGPKTITLGNARHSHLPRSEVDQSLAQVPIPECGFIKAVNDGEGYVSVGWRFSPRFEFDQNRLFAFLSGVDAERVKATFITNNGCFSYNLTADALTEMSFDHFDESRIEIIANELNPGWESALFDSILSDSLDKPGISIA